MMIRRTLAIVAIAVTLWAPVAQAQSVTGTIVRVVDGDTVDVRVDGKVERIRIIGLDTPETVDPRKAVQCFGREASAHGKELLPIGTPVTLEADPSQDARDRYGRMLAFIIVETEPGTTINYTREMIAGGYGHHYVYRRPSLYADAFALAQDDAQVGGFGLWGADTCAGQAYPKRDLEDDAMAPASVALVPVEDDATLADGFDARTFIGKGNAFNCPAFASQAQAQAQAVLRADPRDPNRLDPDRDGVACESIRAPRDTTPVKR